MLEVLTETEETGEGKKRVANILEEQRKTLQFAMSRPQVFMKPSFRRNHRTSGKRLSTNELVFGFLQLERIFRTRIKK